MNRQGHAEDELNRQGRQERQEERTDGVATKARGTRNGQDLNRQAYKEDFRPDPSLCLGDLVVNSYPGSWAAAFPHINHLSSSVCALDFPTSGSSLVQ